MVKEEVQLSQMEQDAKYIKSTINFMKPINGIISSMFGLRNPTTVSVPKNHTGIDIAAKTGTKIISATDGTVILAEHRGDFGKHIKVQSKDIIVIKGDFDYAFLPKIKRSQRRCGKNTK